jgi:radical SAM protein with 4Fe4S-binding SPASM domain
MKLPAKLWRLGRIFAGYKRRALEVPVLPIRLWIESSSVCNLKCIMCPNKDMERSDLGVMKPELFRKLIDEVRTHVSDIYLHHRGEPLVNPALPDLIAYAREAGLRTRFHTNGTLLTEERARRLLDAQPDLMSFSIDGFNKADYERVRVGATFEVTLENIVRLLALRRERGLRKPYIVIERIHFGYSGQPEDAASIAALRRRFLEAGADEVIDKEEYLWAEEKAPEVAAPRPGAVCTFPWYAAVVCWDGTVTPCPQDFFAKMKMGHVAQSTLREIWNGPAYQDLRRRQVSDLGSLNLCHKCDRLHRRTVGGIPLQYMFTFLTDQLIGYSRLRRRIGTAERNRP